MLLDIGWFVLFFQLLGECHRWWTNESPMGNVAKFYSRLRLVCSVWRTSKFPCLKFIEIVILWVYNTIPFGFSLHKLGTFGTSIFNHYLTTCLAKDHWRGLVHEIRIWSMMLIISYLKWCIHLSRSLFLYFYFPVAELFQPYIKLTCGSLLCPSPCRLNDEKKKEIWPSPMRKKTLYQHRDTNRKFENQWTTHKSYQKLRLHNDWYFGTFSILLLTILMSVLFITDAGSWKVDKPHELDNGSHSNRSSLVGLQSLCT